MLTVRISTRSPPATALRGTEPVMLYCKDPPISRIAANLSEDGPFVGRECHPSLRQA